MQCRPQSHLQPAGHFHIPSKLPLADVLFSTRFMVPSGCVSNIRYIIFINPESYFSLPTPTERFEVGRLVGLLNSKLGSKAFICVGPGRWGTQNPDLGIYVSYADVYNAGALVELAGKGIGPAPEPSLGTHFFQDLMEAQIFPLAICFDNEEVVFNRDFFYKTPNSLQAWLPMGTVAPPCLRLIEVAAYRPGNHVELVMDDERCEAVAFLAPDQAQPKSNLPWSMPVR